MIYNDKNIDRLYHKGFVFELMDYVNSPEYSLLIHKQMQEINKTKNENSND
jgi:hypothetical protein